MPSSSSAAWAATLSATLALSASISGPRSAAVSSWPVARSNVRPNSSVLPWAPPVKLSSVQRTLSTPSLRVTSAE